MTWAQSTGTPTSGGLYPSADAAVWNGAARVSNTQSSPTTASAWFNPNSSAAPQRHSAFPSSFSAQSSPAFGSNVAPFPPGLASAGQASLGQMSLGQVPSGQPLPQQISPQEALLGLFLMLATWIIQLISLGKLNPAPGNSSPGSLGQSGSSASQPTHTFGNNTNGTGNNGNNPFATSTSGTSGASGSPSPGAAGSSFDRFFAFARKWEGGLSDDPDDRGGRTNLGVTQAAYNHFLKRTGQPSRPVDRITEAEVRDIYYHDYFKAVGADKIADPRLAMAVADTALNMGVPTAKKMLEQANGDLGQFMELRRQRYHRYASVGSQGKFLNGWLNRLNDLQRQVQA